MNPLNRNILAPALVGAALLLAGCEGDGSNNNAGTIDIGMPEGLTLAMLDSTDGAFYAYDSSSKLRVDLNEAADNSQDESVQAMKITDTSVIGHFLHFPDNPGAHAEHAPHSKAEAHAEAEIENKFLLMLPSYQPGATVDGNSFSVLAHLHDDEVAGHLAEEYRDAQPGSNLAEELERLNAHVTEQNELETEISGALPTDQTLCRAYIDPYVAAEHAHEETPQAKATDMHAEEHLVHYALTDSGRVYFYEDHQGALESMQGHVALTNVASIQDCSRTTISRVSEEGILIFVPDTQTLYEVDGHDGGEFHLHARYEIAELLPEGVRADLVAIIGEGEAHDHAHAQ